MGRIRIVTDAVEIFLISRVQVAGHLGPWAHDEGLHPPYEPPRNGAVQRAVAVVTVVLFGRRGVHLGQLARAVRVDAQGAELARPALAPIVTEHALVIRPGGIHMGESHKGESWRKLAHEWLAKLKPARRGCSCSSYFGG